MTEPEVLDPEEETPEEREARRKQAVCSRLEAQAAKLINSGPPGRVKQYLQRAVEEREADDLESALDSVTLAMGVIVGEGK